AGRRRGDGARRRAAAAGGWPRGGALGGAARPQGRERLARGRAARPGADLEGQLVRPGGDRGAHERHTRRRRRVRLSRGAAGTRDRKSTRLNSSHGSISYAVFCLKKKKTAYIISVLYNNAIYVSCIRSRTQ